MAENDRIISHVPDPKYWEALGRFIETFAAAESVVLHYLGSIIPANVFMMRALFSGLRADAAIDYVRRVWIADVMWTSPPRSEVKAELEPVLSQLKAINKTRNAVVHYMSFVTSDKGRITSNQARALTEAHIRETRISPEILDAMAHDLEKITYHLTSIMLTPPGTPLAERAASYPPLTGAWLYTPEPDQ